MERDDPTRTRRREPNMDPNRVLSLRADRASPLGDGARVTGSGHVDRAVDRETLALLHQGDLGALDALAVRFGGRIERYVRRVLGDLPSARELAEDVTQDALLRAFERGRECRDPATLAPWMFRIARNLATDRVRSRRALERAWSALRDRLRPASAEPSAALEGAELRLAFERALAELPEPFRSAFVLREQEGLSYEEIAEVLGISAKTVSSRIHRARERLRERLRSSGWGGAAGDPAGGSP